jgi:hypothetical protein
MQAIKDHVKGRTDVQKIEESEDSIRFVIDDNYAVEIRMDGNEYVVNYNCTFDHKGNPLMGCWEYEMFKDPKELFDFLNDAPNWS